MADLNPATDGSDPEQFVTLGGDVYFFAWLNTSGTSLFRTNGTPQGTTLVKTFQTGNKAKDLRVAAGRLYFSTRSGNDGEEPWTSDGTPAGTYVLKDINTGAGNSDAVGFTAFGGNVYFAARSATGYGVWVTDGTSAGTRPFFDPQAGISYAPRGFTVSGDSLCFTSLDATGGGGIYRTDGTEAGTVKLQSLSGMASETLDAGGTVYFSARAAGSDPSRMGLWKTDGSPEGTVLLRDFPLGSGTANLGPYSLANVGGTLFFGAATAADSNARALWKSDGTAAGTTVVYDRVPGSQSWLSPASITELNGVAIFAGTDSAAGREVWRSDGTAAGTFRIADTRPGGGSGVASGFTLAGGRLYFISTNDASGFEWSSTDGTAEGTGLVVDLVPGPQSGLRVAPALYATPTLAPLPGGRIVFAGQELPEDLEPYVSDGTIAGTHRLADLTTIPLGSVFYGPSISLGDPGVLFYANGWLYGAGPVTGGAGAVPLAKLGFDSNHKWSPTWAVLNGVAIFVSYPLNPAGGSSTPTLYRSDGTPQGTYPLTGVTPSKSDLVSTFTPLVVGNGYVYFVGNTAATGYELWRTDGTQEGTTLVADAVPGPGSLFDKVGLFSLTTAGDRVYFAGNRDEIWQSDGTAAGTAMLVDANFPDDPLHYPPYISGLSVVGDRLIFTGPRPDGVLGALWTSDGTSAGTGPLDSDVRPSGDLLPFGGSVYFRASRAGETSSSLFRSDGTPGGTVRLTAPGVVPDMLTPFKDDLFFYTNTGVFKTDGTPAGTAIVKALDFSRTSSFNTGLAAVGGRLYFAGKGGNEGTEIWQTDGTAAGTSLAANLYPGTPGSDPQFLVAGAGRLYFSAMTPTYNREWWSIVVDPEVVGRYVFYKDSAFDHETAGDMPGAADWAAVAPDKSALLPGALASFANVTSYTRGLNGIILDVVTPRGAEAIGAADFRFRSRAAGSADAWEEAPAPSSLSVRRGEGLLGADRVTITWGADAVKDGWLEVTVRPTDRTGLSAPDVFFFGNLIGETGDGARLQVNALDLGAVKRALNGNSEVTGSLDFNRDGRVNALDLAAIKAHLNRQLTAPGTTTVASTASPLYVSAVSDTPEGVWPDPPADLLGRV